MRNWIAVCSILAIASCGGVACGSKAAPTRDPPPTALSEAKLLKSEGQHGAYIGVAVNGKYLYLSFGGIHMFEVKNGNDAVEVGVLDVPDASTLVMRGDRLYFRDANGINVADVSDPLTIKPLRVVKDIEFDLWALAEIHDSPTQTVVATTGFGPKNEVILFDLFHPENPEQVARFSVSGAVTSLAIEGNTVYAAFLGGVDIWDVSNWDAPRKLSTTVVDCGLLWVATPGIVFCGGPMPVLDARDPTNPLLVVENTATNPRGLWFGATLFERVGSYVYVQENPEDVVNAYDIADPLHPKRVVIPDPGIFGRGADSTTAIVLDDRFLYVAHAFGTSILRRRNESRE